MILAVDSAIPFWEKAFAPLGEVRPFSGRKLRRETVRDADALIVRSITPVGADLLEGSSVRFVGTASVGTDHLDIPYLSSRGIHFAHTAGSNAAAVAQYVLSALMFESGRRNWELSRTTIAVVGVGHVGSLVERDARALGMRVLLCDPPLHDATGDPKYLPFADVLGADVVTLHVPLTTRGSYPTRHMIDSAVLERFSPDQVLVNSSRGGVVSGSDLKRALREKRIGGAVLDVWEGEPRIDYDLLELADAGTAHIAGSSLDAKVRGTGMILERLCRFFDLPVPWKGEDIVPEQTRIRAEGGVIGQAALVSIVLRAYDIRNDDSELRKLARLPETEAGKRFDLLRNHYHLRPEFPHFLVELGREQGSLRPALETFGFETCTADSPQAASGHSKITPAPSWHG